jgi:hypothetical protein
VVVISDRAQTADPLFFELMGLDVADARTVVVNSRGHFRSGFLTWFPPGRMYEVDTAGLTSQVLERWPFERLRRSSFPLDPETAWTVRAPYAIACKLIKSECAPSWRANLTRCENTPFNGPLTGRIRMSKIKQTLGILAAKCHVNQGRV